MLIQDKIVSPRELEAAPYDRHRPWELTSHFVKAPAAPRSRYVRIGHPPFPSFRVDIHHEEAPVQLAAEEVPQYQEVTYPSPPRATAEIEIAVYDLYIDVEENLHAWEKERAPRRAPRPSERPRRP